MRCHSVACGTASRTPVFFTYEKHLQRVRESNPLSRFRNVAQFRHKYAVGCALREKTQIGPFARFAQNYALRLSEFVRKGFWRFLCRFAKLSDAELSRMLWKSTSSSVRADTADSSLPVT
jgi:hypothetical protein